jgi:succinyl-CoA synthetase beta subunit
MNLRVVVSSAVVASNFGVDVVVRLRTECVVIAEKADVVIKAQILAGGRGLGSFTNGFQGGVHIVTRYEVWLAG